MALERKMLKAMGLTEEQIEAIIDGHTETVTGLTAELAKLKKERAQSDADDAAKHKAESQKEGDEAAKDGEGRKNWRREYDSIKSEFDQYKQQQEAKENSAKIKSAFRELLKAEKIDPDYYDVILRATDTTDMKLDAEGKLEKADALREGIKRDWGKFAVTEGRKGGPVPPSQGGSGGKAAKSKEEIMAIEDTGERVRAIAENHELFGF